MNVLEAIFTRGSICEFIGESIREEVLATQNYPNILFQLEWL